MAHPNWASLHPGLLWVTLDLSLIIQCLSKKNIFQFYLSARCFLTYPLRCLRVPQFEDRCHKSFTTWSVDFSVYALLFSLLISKSKLVYPPSIGVPMNLAGAEWNSLCGELGMETSGGLGRARYFSFVDEFAHKSVFVWPDISCASSCGMSPPSERVLLNHGFKFLPWNQETSTSFGPAQKLVS
jgi:hypothetical protein